MKISLPFLARQDDSVDFLSTGLSAGSWRNCEALVSFCTSAFLEAWLPNSHCHSAVARPALECPVLWAEGLLRPAPAIRLLHKILLCLPTQDCDVTPCIRSYVTGNERKAYGRASLPASPVPRFCRSETEFSFPKHFLSLLLEAPTESVDGT